MKKVLLLILCAAFAASCGKEEEPKDSHPIHEQTTDYRPGFGQPTR